MFLRAHSRSSSKMTYVVTCFPSSAVFSVLRSHESPHRETEWTKRTRNDPCLCMSASNRSKKEAILLRVAVPIFFINKQQRCNLFPGEVKHAIANDRWVPATCAKVICGSSVDCSSTTCSHCPGSSSVMMHLCTWFYVPKWRIWIGFLLGHWGTFA